MSFAHQNGLLLGRTKTSNLLGLHLVELVDLFAHLGHGIVVLLAQVGQDRLVLDVGFLQIAAQFAQLGFAFLVQLDLGSGGTTGFLQALTELFEFAGKIGTLLLSLLEQEQSKV